MRGPDGRGPGGPGPGGRGPGGRGPGGPGPGGFGPRGRPPGLPRRRRLRPRGIVLIAVLALLGYPLALFAVAWTSLGRVDAMPSGDRPEDTGGRTYLVIGSDSREDLSAEDRARLGTGKAAGQRTDTIMLLHVPRTGPTVLVSVPRDSYVPIPGHGKNKINAAYAFGGPQLLIRTLEEVTGLHIDSYVETGLGGYADLVDAVGGVNVCVARDMQDEKAHLDIKAGCQTLDGTTALGYARARYSDPRGDLGRVERQRQVLAAIASRTLSPAVLAVPWRSFPAASAGGHALTVDQGASPWGLIRFVLAMKAVSGGGGFSLTVPVSDPNLSTSVGSAVKWDTAKATLLFDALRGGDTETLRPLVEEQAARSR
ncbi:MAG: LCP family protein [Kineosporiaceae bacterium]